MKIPIRWRVLGGVVLTIGLLVGMLGSFRSREGRQPLSGQALRAPRPEELGRVMPGKPISAMTHRQESPPVDRAPSADSTPSSFSGGSLVPPASEVRRLQQEKSVAY